MLFCYKFVLMTLFGEAHTEPAPKQYLNLLFILTTVILLEI